MTKKVPQTALGSLTALFPQNTRKASEGFAGNRNTKVVPAYGIIIGLLPELHFFSRKDETVQTLLDIFQDTKEVLCRYEGKEEL